MAGLINSALLQGLRPVNQAGQPPWIPSAQVFGQAPAGTQVSVERVGVNAWSIFGLDLGRAPSTQDMADELIAKGHASQVMYMEAWSQDGRILGTGYVSWIYLGVYR